MGDGGREEMAEAATRAPEITRPGKKPVICCRYRRRRGLTATATIIISLAVVLSCAHFCELVMAAARHDMKAMSMNKIEDTNLS